jgi:2-oxoglutarate dehydrogenase E2 component (dihydrolipoamide succinyltransferase)
MMQELSIVMPKMGESVMEATIIRWLKQEGDTLLETESMLEVATDKVDSDIPAPYAGKLKKILVQPGQVIAIGTPIAIIETAAVPAVQPVASVLPSALQPDLSLLRPAPVLPSTHEVVSTKLPLYDASGRFYSPLVRHIAQEAHIPLEQMERIPGTGKGNRVTKQDLLAYLAHRKLPIATQPQVLTMDMVKQHIRPGDEIISMDRVRKLIAERMVTAVHTIPHVTSFVEADVTNLVAGKLQYGAVFQEKTGIGLTYTPIFVRAVAQTIQAFPMINVSVMGEYIIKHKAINIGLAVALPDGNLIVPVVKHADQLNLAQLAIRIHQLVNNARNAQLLPDDVVDGTYTISNIGSFQNLMGTPIIMQPQVAILAVGAIFKKPMVVDSPMGDQIAIRHAMYLSHTYDHRVVDGALGGQFVKSVASYLETFDLGKEISML